MNEIPGTNASVSDTGAGPGPGSTHLELIRLDRIKSSRFEMRRAFDEEALRELATSIQEHGLLHPVSVRPLGDDFELIAGERRLRAVQQLGWPSIPAIIESIPDKEAAIRTVVENLQRADVSPMELARSFKRLTEHPFNLTQGEVAKEFGFTNQSKVSTFISLLDQPKAIQDLIDRSIISVLHVRFLNLIKDEEKRVQLAEQAAREGWSARQTERRAKRLLAKPAILKPMSGTVRETSGTLKHEPASAGLGDLWQFLRTEVVPLLRSWLPQIVQWVQKMVARFASSKRLLSARTETQTKDSTSESTPKPEDPP